MRVHQQAAYVLLNRPYSETSWVVEVFSRDYGRLALMAKGARRIKSKLKGSLLPFQPVLLSWVGKGEMPTLTSAEIDQSSYHLCEHELKGDGLVCGFYCNELIINLLHRYDPHVKLFDEYHSVIMSLNQSASFVSGAHGGPNFALLLRAFEQMVMRETGYEINFKLEADGKTAIDQAAFYRFQSSQGFVRVADQLSSHYDVVSGKVVLSMLELNDASGVNVSGLSSADISRGKHLMRDILRQTLGQKKIISRELFFPKAR